MIPKVHPWKTLHKMEASGFINTYCINMNTCVYIYIMCVCPNTRDYMHIKHLNISASPSHSVHTDRLH